jgi:hypothetical protein
MIDRQMSSKVITSLLVGVLSSAMIFNFSLDFTQNYVAFAQTDNYTYNGPIPEDNYTLDNNSIDNGSGPIAENNSTDLGTISQVNSTDLGIVPQDNSSNLDVTQSENLTAGINATSNQQSNENYQSNQQGIDEINNENNNEKATHQENQQDSNSIQNAIENKTIAAEVDIGASNVNQKSIDNNVTVKTENTTSDTVNLTVSAADQTGPKVIVINLNSTTIDVANLKYLHVMYDGHSITPATNVDQILHTTRSDEPHYAILITQSGAQILISIPHFSTHTITLSSISKVIQPVPEFPLSVIAVFSSIIAITIVITRKRIALNY